MSSQRKQVKVAALVGLTLASAWSRCFSFPLRTWSRRAAVNNDHDFRRGRRAMTVSVLAYSPVATSSSRATTWRIRAASNAERTSDASERTSTRGETSKRDKRKRRRRRRPFSSSERDGAETKTTALEWRIFGVEVDPDALGPDVVVDSSRRRRPRRSDDHDDDDDVDEERTDPSSLERSYLTVGVVRALCARLRVPEPPELDSSSDAVAATLPVELTDARVVRRSLDARRNRGRRTTTTTDGAPPPPSSPVYNYVIDVVLSPATAKRLRLKHQPGRCEATPSPSSSSAKTERPMDDDDDDDGLVAPVENDRRPRVVVVVGAGPAGLFCALRLVRSDPRVVPIVLERGRPVQARGRSIGALVRRAVMDPESNFLFGEGGAGTWSDGKLTTRVGRNSEAVRYVLRRLVEHGAPENVLVDGAPHVGTDNLVKVLRSLRDDLIDRGADVRFDARVTRVLRKRNGSGGVEGVEVEYRADGDGAAPRRETLRADAVVLATGHSARDVYEELAVSGVLLEPKGFASGFRIEHPQSLVNRIQYGEEWSPSVRTGRRDTDAANALRNPGTDRRHVGRLPVASYRLATDEAFDGEGNRGVYSFCMCPGGQIVPASTDPNELCVNGMSFSARNSRFANSGFVVAVRPDDPVLEPYREEHGVLAGVAFQRDMERRAATLGGGNLVCPVQTVRDFLEGRPTTSSTRIDSSYRLGVRTGTPVHEIYPDPLVAALRDALANKFDRRVPGYVSDEGVLHAVETRTSSPVRVARSDDTLQAIGLEGLYPAGEGAGFAGGIVSAAVDGMMVAEAVIENLVGLKDERTKMKAVGFDY